MTNVVSSSHELFFDAKFYLTPQALIDSLAGFEDLVGESVRMMRKAVPHMSRFETRILIKKVEAGSNFQETLVELIFGTERKKKKTLKQLRQALHIEDMTPGKFIMILAAGAVLLVAWRSCATTASPKAAQIYNSFNNCSIQLNLTPEQFRALYDSTKPEKLEQAVIKLVRPNETKPEGALTLSADGETIRISPEELEPIPVAQQKPPAEIVEDEELRDAPMVVKAIDLDKAESGWAAILPEYHETRLPIKLAYGINPLEVPIGKTIYGHVRVVRSKDSKGEIIPVGYILESFTPLQKPQLQASTEDPRKTPPPQP